MMRVVSLYLSAKLSDSSGAFATKAFVNAISFLRLSDSSLFDSELPQMVHLHLKIHGGV